VASFGHRSSVGPISLKLGPQRVDYMNRRSRTRAPRSGALSAKCARPGRRLGSRCSSATVERLHDANALHRLGCSGFLLAAVKARPKLDVVRDRSICPPAAAGRPGGLVTAGSKLRAEAWRESVERRFSSAPQIETCVGMQHAEAIARHAITNHASPRFRRSLF